MTAVARYRASVTEAQMEDAIRDLVALRGGRCFHVRDSRQSPEMTDFPDLVILLPGFCAIAELKSARREITIGQRRVLTLLDGVERFWGGVVRPQPCPGELSYDDFLNMLGGKP